MITPEIFFEKTGQQPEKDDLERVNCKKAGELGHGFCGWCSIHDLPKFSCGCPYPHTGQK